MQNLQSKTPYKFKKSYGGTPEPQTPQDAPWLRGPSLKSYGRVRLLRGTCLRSELLPSSFSISYTMLHFVHAGVQNEPRRTGIPNYHLPLATRVTW